MITAKSKIGFLGFGKMGRAIAAGLSKAFPTIEIGAYDVVAEPAGLPARAFASPAELENWADVVLLCVKPQDMAAAVKPLSGQKQYLSIAAGLSLDKIKAMFGRPESVQIARAMPNISATVGRSMTGLYCQHDGLREQSNAIFEAVGRVVIVSKEELLHAVTALSGSGPAFVFAFADALAQGGVLAGLTYDDALALALGTLEGAAALARETHLHPAVLKSQVTSPGGTTIAGLLELEKGAFSGDVMNAVRAAWLRSKELGS